MIKWWLKPMRSLTTTTITTTTAAATATMTTTNRALICRTIILVISILCIALVPLTNGFRTTELNVEGRKLFGGYRITPKNCRATKTLPFTDPRSHGPTICMFNHECAQRNGEVVGACMDGFLFGACCQVPSSYESESTLINDAQNAYFQQHHQQQQQQQQKFKLQQQAQSNPAAALSYEQYGETSQNEHKNSVNKKKKPSSNNHHQQQHDVYNEQENIDQVYQQLDSSSSSSNNIPSSVSPQPSSNSYQSSDEQEHASAAAAPDGYPQESNNLYLSVQPTAASYEQNVDSSTSQHQNTYESDLEQDANVHAQPEEDTKTNSLTNKPPPRVDVHKDSVKISSPSSSSHNDDFVMQVLSTLPPGPDATHISFSTEVPMKITSSLTGQASSESSSFEETPSSQSTTTKSPNRRVASTRKPDNDKYQQQQHDILVLHDDIDVHPGLIEDLQFSTGYGPQAVYAKPSSSNKVVVSSSTIKTPLATDDKYVLVQTFTNKKPSQLNDPTTSSSITTHADSIESIILQLNNTNHGPTYNLVSQQTPSYSYDHAAGNYVQQNDYYESTLKPSPTSTTTTRRPPPPPQPSAVYSTGFPSDIYDDNIETKRPENDINNDGPSPSVPAYLEPVATDLNLHESPTDTAVYDPVYDPVSEEKDSPPNTYMQNEYPTPKPIINEVAPSAGYGDETASVLDEHTIPDNNYNDVIATGHPTSEFNKMPAVGIAYPVDMSYIEEDIALDEEKQPGYGGQVSSSTALPRPIQTSTPSSYDNTPDHHTEQYAVPAYTKVPPFKNRPGVITSQNYHQQQQPQASNYNQVPNEVSVSSHTTQVQEDYDHPSSTYEIPQTVKYTTPSSSYYEASTTTTTLRPPSAAPSTVTYISSTSSPVANRPQYVSSTSSRPQLVTAKPKPRPRPKPSTDTNKTKKPQNSKRPQQPTNQYSQQASQISTSTYNPNYVSKKPIYQSSSSSYSEESYTSKPPSIYITTNSATYPTAAYNQVAQNAQPTNTYTQNEEGEIKRPAATTSSHHTNKPPSPVPQPSSNYNSAPPVRTKKPTSAPALADPSESTYGQNVKLPEQPLFTYNQHVASSPPKRPVAIQRPANKKPAISASYISGPTTARPPTTVAYHDNEVPPLLIADDKLDSFVHSTASALTGVTPTIPTYQSPVYVNSVTPIHIQRPQHNYHTYKKPGFVKIQQMQPTIKPPSPTVLITPKPTVLNLVTSSSWKQKPQTGAPSSIDPSGYPSTTPLTTLGSTSYVYSPVVTRRPDASANTPEYVSLPSIMSNDFDDPGYYGAQPSSPQYPAFTQATTEITYGVPSDDKPAFPGYYGPTPTYPTFEVPSGEKLDSPVEEETYTSPNDFVNFPPVRNPNLNMSATSSAVTTDLELSTPAFVEDIVLKNKMNTLVHKIVESLQGNFDALSDMIDESNHTASTFQATQTAIATNKPTRKPTRITTVRPKSTSTKPPTKTPPKTTRKPTVTRNPTTTTRKPAASRKPSKKIATTTTISTLEDEIVDEEDEEDVNPSDNEIVQEETNAQGGRKFKCGVRPHVKSGRIVGGKGSTFGAYPWQVLVRESTWLGLFTKNKCGGVLITSRYVITAAHCQPGFLASLVAVMGEFDISGDLESKRSVTKNVKRVIVHRQYDPATFENDLALLELDSSVQFDTHIVPICMPSDHADFTGRMATVTGWGRLKYGGGVPTVLQEVQVPVIENSVCQEMFHTAGHNKKILGSFLCAGYANGQKDSCEGDSGGPLVLQRPDGRYELAGTVSHGIKCAAPYLPGVYMRTTFYKPWLRSITGVK